jgi:prolyl oligopeptidase
VDALTNFEKYSQPWHRAGRTFFFKNDGRQNHSVLYVQEDGSPQPRVLLDPNTFSADGTTSLAFADESTDGRYMAFGKSEGGSDWRDIYVMDLETGTLLPDVILGVKNGGVSWYGNGFYYSKWDAAPGAEKSLTEKNSVQTVYYHVLGTDPSTDAVIFRDPSKSEQFVGCYVLENSRYLLRWVRTAASRGSQIFIRPVDAPDAPWKVLYASDEYSFFPRHDENGVLYGTTDDGSPNGRVVRVKDPLGDPRFETVVAERAEVLDGLSFGGGRMFLTWMKDVHNVVEMADLEGRSLGMVALPGPGTVGGFSGQPTDTVLYYTFTSYTYPTTIFAYDLARDRSSVWHAVKAPFDPTAFTAEQVFVKSKDGTKVPMFVIAKRGLTRDGTAPTILYGYGGFNVSLNPSFNPNLIAWLEQGGVMAIANLRGGSEYGEAWHEAGTKTKKQNVFDDAIACAEWLIANKVTSPQRLAINGGSNGGLLVGAVINQRPDLFRAAVPEVGVMDMLRFHLFTIGWNWQADYGEVSKKDEFEALLAYSPYHNLRADVAYPSVMVMTADHDDRVVPAHSFKYAAMLQHVYRGSNPALLRVQIRSGHGAVNRRKQLENVADRYAFLWNEMGFTPTY